LRKSTAALSRQSNRLGDEGQRFIDTGKVEGERRPALFRIACDMNARGWTLAEAEGAIMGRVHEIAPPLNDEQTEDLRRQIGNAFKQQREPGYESTPAQRATTAALASLPVAGNGGCTDLSRPQTWEEVHLARRLAKQIRGRLVYVRERNMWLAFNGKRWLERADHITVQECKRLHDELWRELGELPAEERTAAAVRFVQSTGTKRRIDAIIGLARSEPGINVSQADFDTHPWLLNVENGVLDLRSGELLLHDPALRLTQLAAVTYDPEARSELWERFMREVTSGDEQIENFLQQSFGLALTGDVSDEVLICHNGGGCNGKSTALEAVGKMLGDYAAVAPPGLFMARSFDSHPTEIAALHGKRFVTAIEQEANRALRESLVKSLTGGDTIRTRRMREDFWEMRPTWHIHVAYNRAPRLTGTDDGIRRRLRVVPWAASFKDRPDLTIKERLTGESERSGILTWCLEGLRRRLAVGRLESPAAVMIATDEYLDDEDLVGRFIADRCVEGARVETEIRSALAAFRAWMIEDGTPRHVIDGYTVNVLGRELARRGFPKRRPDSGPHRKRTVYVGLSVSSECEYAQPGEEWSSPFPD
jgi:putative DNA primase/helicase